MSKFGFKKFFTPFGPPFIDQGDGITPALGDDVRVCPFLPITPPSAGINQDGALIGWLNPLNARRGRKTPGPHLL